MQTSLRIDGANCPTCFNETLDDLAHLDGVRRVHGSVAGPCIEIDHDVPIEAIERIIRSRLHGVEMYSNEIRMVPLEPVALTSTCQRHRAALRDATTPLDAGAPSVEPSMTLGEIVTRHPALAAELERRGLDYCCHGGRTLLDAARAAGLDAITVASDLSAVDVDRRPAEWASLGPAELVDHITTVHHGYLWVELPRIGALVDKITAVHGDRHPELADVQRRYRELRADLEPHLAREEQEVFPMIRRFVETTTSPAEGRHLAARIDALAGEHETVGELLDELRRLSDGYVVPADGCASYAACYRALAELEADTHLHVHKENNLLFPAARAR
ncbi:MAG: iron-sulfur cluster repair di-iron protein [Ilumatobacteraceae bacterium]